jgi:hypothetical protein
VSSGQAAAWMSDGCAVSTVSRRSHLCSVLAGACNQLSAVPTSVVLYDNIYDVLCSPPVVPK